MYPNENDNEREESTVEKLIKTRQWNVSLTWLFEIYHASELTGIEGTTYLHLAAKYDNVELIQFLIEEGYEVDAKDVYGTTPLMVAVLFNNCKSIEYLLEHNADIFTTDIARNYALKIISRIERCPPQTLILFLNRVEACSKSNEEIAEKLSKVAFPLDFVVKLKNAEVTKLILQKGIAVREIESYRSMLNTFQSLDIENIEVLLHYGRGYDTRERRIHFFELFNTFAKSTNPTWWDRTIVITQKCIEWSLINGETIGFIERLFEKSQKVPLKVFFDYNLNEHIKETLNYDSSIHVFGNRNVNVFEILIENEFNVHTRGREDLTALHVAVKYGIVGNVKYLLENGANPNGITKQGLTPFFCVFEQQDPYDNNEIIECLRLLLQYGGDLQIRDNFRRSIFEFHEVDEKQMPLMKILLAHLALHEALGGTIDQKIYDSIFIDNMLKDYLEKCRQQIGDMKNLKICESLSVFTVLSKRPENLARMVGAQDRESITALINCENVQKLSYYYRTTMRERLQRAALVNDCRNNAAEVLAKSIEMLPGYTLVIDEIISYLTLSDLIVFQKKPCSL